MSKRSLEELTRLSTPALRHAELVNFARTESPNRAYELASARWPRRQAKATRFLAILRRDHNLRAFEALTMEHARPNGSEHAQGGSKMYTMDQMYPEGVRDVYFGHRGAAKGGAKTLSLVHITGDGHKTVDFLEEVERLNIDDTEVMTLVRRVAEGMLDQWANPKTEQFHYGTMWASALRAARLYLSEVDSELIKKLLLATVVYQGGHDKYVGTFVRDILPDPKGESTMQDVVDHLLESGLTEDEVLGAWVEMLNIRRRQKFKTAYITDWWQGVKIGEANLRTAVEPLARDLLFFEFHDILVNGCFDWNHPLYDKGRGIPEDFMAETVDFLLRSTSHDWRSKDEEAREQVEGYLVQCIARGKVGTAFYMLVRYGEQFSMWSRYGDRRRGPDETAEAVFERLMRAAVSMAEATKNYGIASALAEHVGDVAAADRCRPFARKFEQPIALDFAVYRELKGER